MRSEKELFRLAKDMTFIEDKLQEGCNSMVREELTEEAVKIRKILLEKHYDANTFLYYKDLYKTMTIEEYYEFIKFLDRSEKNEGR